MAWLYTSHMRSVLDAAFDVRSITDRQRLEICGREEIAWRQGFIDDAQLERPATPLRKSSYGDYLLQLQTHRRSGQNHPVHQPPAFCRSLSWQTF